MESKEFQAILFINWGGESSLSRDLSGPWDDSRKLFSKTRGIHRFRDYPTLFLRYFQDRPRKDKLKIELREKSVTPEKAVLLDRFGSVSRLVAFIVCCLHASE